MDATLIIILLVILGLAIYFLPTLIAIARGKQNSIAIFALNLLLGWSLIGWVIALVWALTLEDRGIKTVPTVSVTNTYPAEQSGTTNEEIKQCPFCAEKIKANATLCKYCHSKIPVEQELSPRSTDQVNDSNFSSLRDVAKLHTAKPIPLLWLISGSMLILGFFVLMVFTFAGKQLWPWNINSHMPASADSGINSKDVNILIDQVLQAANTGDYASIDKGLSALDSLPKPVSGNNNEATSLNKVGLSSLKNQQYGNAIDSFKRATQADPSSSKYLSNLGFAELKNNDLGLAIEHLNSSIALAPYRSVAWGDLGEAYAKKGNQDNAIACFLIGYKVSSGNTLSYLKSLQDDPDPVIREAGGLALNKVQSSTEPTPIVDSSVPDKALTTDGFPSFTPTPHSNDGDKTGTMHYNGLQVMGATIPEFIQKVNEKGLSNYLDQDCLDTNPKFPGRKIIVYRINGLNDMLDLTWTPDYVFVPIDGEMRLYLVVGDMDAEMSDHLVEELGSPNKVLLQEHDGTRTQIWIAGPQVFTMVLSPGASLGKFTIADAELLQKLIASSSKDGD